ncbi:MAG: hypothetical protein MMC33_006470 [Icmadophila ericetorum]|nr:hypothetical protein [Icmadophila ericetorum]
MTAVASPPSFQPLPRLGWNPDNNPSGALNSMSADDIRTLMPRKNPQRSNSSSSIASSSSTSSASSTSTVLSAAPQTNGVTPATNGNSESWAHRKKPTRGLWPSPKAEPSIAIDARPQSLPIPPSGQSAASVMSAIHQPAPMLPSQSMNQGMQQQNGVRGVSAPGPMEPHAILVLLPMNGTFERKQITVPFAPDILRIGRQTNAKTVPTPNNGYFDSKVLSRQHAEVWADRNGKIWIRDVKSSNGTFVNGTRLSPENKESEPHGLRDHDVLELGIDIVSEDQKTIVHHKVSAKVEHAGIVSNSASVLDLNFGDIDPASGGGLMGPSFPQQVSQGRGRNGSLGSPASTFRSNGPHGILNNMNGMMAHRQMNAWLSPITIEQVVKRLTTELKQAKQQSHDLNRTGEFFNTLLSQEPGQAPPIPACTSLQESQTNGIQHSSKLDPMSPFSQPPAPPPQQPLPQKPDTNGVISLKRIETEKPLSPGAGSSPTKNEGSSSQILSLVEALTSAKREIVSQSDKVKHLEDLLRQERKAREGAEEHARRLLEARSKGFEALENGLVEEDAFNPPAENSAVADKHLPNGYEADDESQHGEPSSPTLNGKSKAQVNQDAEDWSQERMDLDVSRLQARLDATIRDMDEMKVQMEKYRRRAEGAEDEKNTLLQMIERIRKGEVDATAIAPDSPQRNSTEIATQTEEVPEIANENETISTSRDSESSKHPPNQNGKAVEPIPGIQELDDAMAMVLTRSNHRNDKLVQVAPYASMLSVVLLGVGIMTYLNNWQKIEK